MSEIERLVEVCEPEIRIDFALNCKCRATVRLRSLCATSPVAFKIQTSSPNKFLVNPPCGLISPSSSATFQVILKPQSQLPPTYPRSPSDRFLIKTAEFLPNSSAAASSTRPDSINSWFASLSDASPTHNLKLKVAFVGPVLLRDAVSRGDLDAVRNFVKRQRSVLADLSFDESESLLRVATELVNPDAMVHLLLEAGLRVEEEPLLRSENSNPHVVVDPRWASKGWDELHVAAAFDRTDEVLVLSKKKKTLGTLDSRDHKGRTALHLAVEKGSIGCARVLVEAGADKDGRCNDGGTPLLRAAANGDRRMVEMLIEMGADPTISDDRGLSSIDIARDEGHVSASFHFLSSYMQKEVVEIMEQGEEVVAAARHGDVKKLESLLKRGGSVYYKDQYGLTALHAAAMKGHKDVVLMLCEAGVDLESQDVEGHAPLHMAVEGGDEDTIQVLVKKGVNVNAQNKKGATPLYLARILGYNGIAQFLVSQGAVSSFPVILR
ncbi:serine/threonine-protein phosphatase 6 regulatory ankyrin repeat subunit B-like [Senna tora]|uniref:Serine/threonine-protein phosphatase 6 regulatory ankyrin repeat subunit B-like n=1 Tax=Senna tora TaxID=362788 RepID=A0A834TZG2_9FABA|nr:serine/threonine-protein phosphatase 6 regulatory ankyrin repeat subunit B-like [Senna tora]